MIFLLFFPFQTIFAQKNTHETILDLDGFQKNILDKDRSVGQPRFNATCDELSLNLAAKCEERWQKWTKIWGP